MFREEPKSNGITVVIREVWAWNIESEFAIISSLIDKYPFISMDTEFPGVIYRSDPRKKKNRGSGSGSGDDLYRLLKSNVDELNLIQLGLTLSDASGNLPHLNNPNNQCYIWEFNFSDFDVDRDPHAADSVHLLTQQGIDFQRNKKEGVDSLTFAELIMSSGLLCNHSVSWVTFHSAYDFAYLIKILTRRPLPSSLLDFLAITRVSRAVGKSHQAGSDSLLTWHAFQKMVHLFFRNHLPHNHSGVIYGLHLYSY
ncbi:putative CCR4-associated factor 1-like protein 9 [Bienertia sinuspersici]